MGYVGGGTGEHTFPGQLAAQGCGEPSAARLTLATPEQTQADLERQRGSGTWRSQGWGNIMQQCAAIYHSKQEPRDGGWQPTEKQVIFLIFAHVYRSSLCFFFPFLNLCSRF